MFFIETPHGTQSLVYSATDLVRAAECTWATLRVLDERLGRAEPSDAGEDPMLARAARLGAAHEAEILAELRQEHGDGVVEIPAADSMTHAALTAQHEASMRALRAGAPAVFQATFFDGRFYGRADFLIRQPDGSYGVYDTKLARRAKVTALLQLAAYADQLQAAGIPVADEVTLILGTKQHASFSVSEFQAVYEERRARFEDLAQRHMSEPDPAEWLDESIGRCGRCGACSEQVSLHGDVLAVAGMTMGRRKRLRDQYGVRTVEDLAALDPAGKSTVLAGSIRQAQMQLGTAEPDGSVVYTDSSGAAHTVSYALMPGADRAFKSIPRATPGDIFFDFEGDPLWQDPQRQASGQAVWGLEYLFGLVEAPTDTETLAHPRFRAFWAHDRAGERQALLDFLAYVRERRAQYPAMKIYHYANYEKRALAELAARHGVGEEDVDTLLRENVLVDLYTTVREALRVSQNSYSIKKLEPLYMPADDLRTGDVTDAGASVVAYAEYCAARDSGQTEAAQEILASISDYNEYDCRSTLRLRDWLLELAGRSASEEMQTPETVCESLLADGAEDDDAAGPSETEAALLEFAETATCESTGLSPDELERTVQAVAMVASAMGYHRRERKQFWWDHFNRLIAPLEDWAGTKDVVVFDRLSVEEDWHTPPRARTERRILAGLARIAEGHSLKPGASGLFAMYDTPLPAYMEDKVLAQQERIDRVAGGNAPLATRASEARVTLEGLEPVSAPGGPTDLYAVTLVETRPKDAPAFDELPLALTPAAPIRTDAQEAALAALAEEVRAALPRLPAGAGLDILARRTPRLTGGELPQPGAEPHASSRLPVVSALLDALMRLDDSYLAVQGPPGTGKSFVGGTVIGELVSRGWRIGVVAQSHAVIENLLRGCVRNGKVPLELIAQAESRSPRTKDEPDEPSEPSEPTWNYLKAAQIPAFLSGEEPAGGRIYGGTAWDFANEKRFPQGGLDLLVIDEAGQYSLANMLAVSQAARNVLMLGDPQQLPQVTQGSHPQPVDESALGWLADGHETLPAEFGYFLETTWRMHPELCAPVSRLSYGGRLHSADAASQRRLGGVEPGVHRLDVAHTGNTTSSAEEAAAVVDLARQFLGLPWNPGPDGRGRPQEDRPLSAEDILVVAAYNAQVDLIAAACAEVPELSGVRAGTVDKFQGQEAPVVIVSMAASSAGDVPRGMDFLLSPNRLNVAVSRGQWCAVLLSSPALTDYLPTTPAGLSLLGGFTGLRHAARRWSALQQETRQQEAGQ